MDEAKKCYGEDNLVPITNIKQIIFYAKHGCQPKFIWESEKEENKIVAWFFKPETEYIYKRWIANRPKSDLNEK